MSTSGVAWIDDWRTANRLLAVMVVLVGMIYVGNTWSPSSYGLILTDVLGYRGVGPDFGVPRPIRSDEYAVVTPLTQATINNAFERYNKTSLYKEDLRINYGLPIHDWGIVFKPTMWLYGWTNPAVAYSFHWYAIAVLFVIGYAWLFRWIGAGPLLAISLSGGLFFTGVAQFWWNEKGPLFALFPWAILPFATRWSFPVQGLLFYWISVSWLLTNFYPPVQVSLAFVGFITVLALRPDLFRWRQLAKLAAFASLAAATAAFYLLDYQLETSVTVYPGGRNVSGGGLPLVVWLSWLVPTVMFDSHFKPMDWNISEVGSAGMYYLFPVLCLLDYSRLGAVWSDSAVRRRLIAFGAGAALMLAWMTIPFPAWVGKILLWNNVQPLRMQFAGGVMVILFIAYLAGCVGFRVTAARIAIFCAAFIATWVTSQYGELVFSQVAFVGLLCLAAAGLRTAPAKYLHSVIALLGVFAGAISFGTFNPLQPAWPIFNSPKNETLRRFDQLAADNDGLLAVTGLPGAVGNGLGYQSLSHVTPTPKLQFWRAVYPEIPEAEFNQLFNRYSHIIPDHILTPRLGTNDSVIVSVVRNRPQVPVTYVGYESGLPKDGRIDLARVEDETLILYGWAPWGGARIGQRLELVVWPAPSGPASYRRILRQDLPAASGGRVSMTSGFDVRLPLDDASAIPAVCAFAYDPASATRVQLINPANLRYCEGMR